MGSYKCLWEHSSVKKIKLNVQYYVQVAVVKVVSIEWKKNKNIKEEVWERHSVFKSEVGETVTNMWPSIRNWAYMYTKYTSSCYGTYLLYYLQY